MPRDSAYQAWVEVVPDFSGFSKKANAGIVSGLGVAGAAGAGAFGGSFKSGVGQIFTGNLLADLAGGAARAAGQLIGTAISAGIQYSLTSIDLASSLNESLNATKVTFGDDIAAQLTALGQTAPQRLALTRNAFAGLTVQFGAFAKTIRGNDVVGFLDELTNRGADFASVYNLEVADALTLFQSGLAGETEPLRKFGLDLSAAAVESYAYRNGIAAVGTELTEAEKIQARYGALLEQTNQVVGDNANTAGEYAGQQRRLNAALEEAQTNFGQALLPTALDLTTFANDELLPIISAALDKAGPALSQSLTDIMPEIKDLVSSAADNLPAAIEAAVGAAGLISQSIEGDLKFVEDAGDAFATVDGFFNDYLPRWAAGSVTVEESWDGFFQWWDVAWDGSADTVNNKSNEIKDYWSQSIAALKKTTQDAAMQSEGVAFAQGFADGITSRSEAAVLAAEQMALRARDKVRSAMQIQSPSKVMHALGGYVSEGFALGISANASMVDSALASMVALPTSPLGTTTSSSGSRDGTVRDVHFHTEDPMVAFQMMKQQIGGELAIR